MLSLSVNIRNENTVLIPLSIIQNLPPDSSFFWGWGTCDLILWTCNMCPFIHKVQVTLLVFPIPALTKSETPLVVFCCASGCTHVKAIVGFCFIWGLIVSFLVKYWTHYRNREFSLWISAWKQSGLALPWLSDMFCMIQCLSLEMSQSEIRRSWCLPKGRVPFLKTQAQTLLYKYKDAYTHTLSHDLLVIKRRLCLSLQISVSSLMY